MNRKPKGKKKMDNQKGDAALLDRIVTMIVGGIPTATVEDYCTKKSGKTLEQAREIIADARRRITISADYTKDEQLALAIRRVEDLYSRSVNAGDPKTALQAQKELNKLMSLYTPRRDTQIGDADIAGMKKTLKLIAAHILPLGLASQHLPLEEHARLAAVHIARTKAQ